MKQRLPKEDPIEPDLPICDPHHHLWDYPDDFPEKSVPPFARHIRHYLLTEFLEDTGRGHNIEQTVFMECRSMYRKEGLQELRPIGETEFVNGIAAQSASGQYRGAAVAAGIVGFADLTLGNAVAPVLEAHIDASRNRFRGIRYASTWDASEDVRSRIFLTAKTPNLLSDPKFREGFAYLRKYDLSFDAWLYHPQLMELVDLADAFSDTTIIMNHTAGPLGIGPYAGKRDEVFQTWKHGIVALSNCPNVVIKLGGLGVPAAGFGWHERSTPPNSAELAETMAPYYSWCIDHFGTDRCMFESNFPVDKLSYPYITIWNAFKRLTKDYSSRDRAALFHDTAVKVYRLTPR